MPLGEAAAVAAVAAEVVAEVAVVSAGAVVLVRAAVWVVGWRALAPAEVTAGLPLGAPHHSAVLRWARGQEAPVLPWAHARACLPRDLRPD